MEPANAVIASATRSCVSRARFSLCFTTTGWCRPWVSSVGISSDLPVTGEHAVSNYSRSVLRWIVCASCALALVAGCSSGSSKGGLTPVSGGASPLAELVVAPPKAFAQSVESDAHNGALTPQQFDDYIGAANASKKTHLVHAYQATYDSVGNEDSSILVVVAELKSEADAAKFKNMTRHSGPFKSTRADPLVRPTVSTLAGVPGGTLIEPKKRDDDGIFDHAAVAARGTHVMFIDLITTRSGRFPVLAELARKQYTRL